MQTGIVIIEQHALCANALALYSLELVACVLRFIYVNVCY